MTKLNLKMELEFSVCLFLCLLSLCISTDLPPVITVQPDREYMIRSGKEILLTCEASGSPEPTYTWLKDDFRIDMNENSFRIMSKGNLHALHPDVRDAGVYQCFAENAHGVAMSDVSVVAVASDGLNPPIPNIHSVRVVTVDEGGPLVLHADLARSRPASNYFWLTVENNEVFTFTPLMVALDARVNIDQTGNLHFAHVESSDAVDGRLYSYSVNSTVTGVRLARELYQIKVIRTRNYRKPRLPKISFHSNSTQALVGDDISLQCIFSGLETPIVSWSRYEGHLDEERHSFRSFESVLEIRDVHMADEGTYECVGMNSRGWASYRMDITVQSRPVFPSQSREVRPVSINTTEGENVEFNCKPDAVPEARVQWFINGRPLDEHDTPERISILNAGTTLRISEICKDCSGERLSDLMVIQCKGSNPHGGVVGEGYLNVLDSPPLGNSAPVCSTVEACHEEIRQLQALIRQREDNSGC